MKVEEIREKLHWELEPFFLEQGYKFRKSGFAYVRKNHEVLHAFSVLVLPKTEWFHVIPEVSVVCPKVNELYASALGRKKRLTECTSGFSVRNEHRERGSYSIDCAEDISGVVHKIKADYVEVAAPFFQQVYDLRTLEAYMNQRCETGRYRPDRSNPCLGLIAAKLVQNPEYEVIFRDYYDFWKQAQGAALAAPILQVKEFLEPSKGSSQPIALLGPPRD
jgi:hypothetical protein